MWIEKVIDLIIAAIINFLIYTIKIIFPITINPKEIEGKKFFDDWKNIYSFKIANRSNRDLYDMFIVGISKEKFEVKIISDDAPKGKTVERMNLDTNRLVVYATDPKTDNYLWCYRIHKFCAKEVLNLSLKIENKKKVFFKALQYSLVEVPIRERDNGVVAIPFDIKKIPKIK